MLAIDYDNPERISRFEKELPSLFPDLYIVKYTPYFLEFSNKEASKYCAVKFLQKYWNLKDEEILTIGDQVFHADMANVMKICVAVSVITIAVTVGIFKFGRAMIT